MFLISTVLDGYFSLRLRKKSFRLLCYKKAIEHKLRKGRLNTNLLKNLNVIMSVNNNYHEEFREVLNGENFQKGFWESDLGYLWYKGNLNTQNVYFNFANAEIKKHCHTSLLDVGCGWGEFPNKASQILSVNKVVGIDVSENIIEQAKKINSGSKAIFLHKNVLEISEKFDLITFFGSTDYIAPQDIYPVIEKTIQLANKQILIVNSLRNIPFEKAIEFTDSLQIKRYDVGYVHPLKNYLDKLKIKYSFLYTIEKAGQDSVMVNIKI